MSGRGAPLLAGAVAVALLSACMRFGGAPAGAVDEAPVLGCEVQDWHLRGMTEGASGAAEDVVEAHLRRCPPADEAEARAAFLEGHEAGLTGYCTPSHAYQLGRLGGRFQAVCPVQERTRLQDAYLDGRQVYTEYLQVRKAEQRLADIEQFSRVGAISERDHRHFGVEPTPDIARVRSQWAALRALDDRLRERHGAPQMPYYARH